MKFTFLFLFFSQLLVAQNFTGIVLDSETKTPLENITVYFERGQTGTTTNISGKFSLKTSAVLLKEDNLQFSFIGYTSKTIALETFRYGTTTIYLSKKLEDLDEVLVKTYKEDLQKSIKFKTLAPLKTSVYAFGSQIIGDSIYVVSGNSSYTEDSGKKALQTMNQYANPTFADFMKEFQLFNFNYEAYNNTLQIYDIQNNTWSISDTKFRKRAFNNVNSHRNTLYSLGGKRLSPSKKYEYLDDKIEVFDLDSNEIKIDDTNPHQAIYFASFNYQDNIIAMGGSTKLNRRGDKEYTDAAHIYNITSGLWYELTTMTTPKETQGVIIDNIIYLIGGNNGSPLKTMESYNITTGIWTNEGQLFEGMEQPGLATHNNIIYIFNDEKLLTFNTITKSLKEYEILLKLKNSKLHYHKNKLYIVGGFTQNTHTIAASAKLYAIDLIEFDKTTIKKAKLVK